MFDFHQKLKKVDNQLGFTLIELMIVLGISSILFGFVVFNLVRFQNTSSQQSNTDSLISDIRTQQQKAMEGITDGRPDSDDYGVYFQTNNYILFYGSVYNPVDPDNFQVDLPADLEFQSTTLPNNSIIFTRRSGEMPGFVVGQDSFTIRAVNIERDIVVTINRYGVITTVN